jgi:beta-lactamase regulating signal transducer with metallopeptidase domain
VTAWIVQSLAASTLIMLALIALRPWLHRWAPPQLVYALWLVPALRLVMPALPILAPDTPVAGTLTASPAPLSNVTASAIDGTAVFMLLWLGGAAAYLAVQLWRYLRFLRTVRAATLGCATATGPIPVRISAAVDGPMAAGLVCREIFVPVDFERRFAPEERRLALAHERMHHSRHDLPANLAALVVLSLHWFNPLAHYAHRLFRADQELACDADVMRRAPGQGAVYGRTLLKASDGIPAILCQLSDIALLKQRLGQLSRGPRDLARGRLIAIVPVAALIVALSAATHAPPSTTGRPAPRVAVGNAAFAAARAVPQLARRQRQSQRPASESVIVASRLPAPERPAAPASIGNRDTSPIDAPAPGQPEGSQLQATTLESPAEKLFPSAADRLGNPTYLALRREEGLERGRKRYVSAADAAATRGRPLNHPPPAD